MAKPIALHILDVVNRRQSTSFIRNGRDLDVDLVRVSGVVIGVPTGVRALAAAAGGSGRSVDRHATTVKLALHGRHEVKYSLSQPHDKYPM